MCIILHMVLQLFLGMLRAHNCIIRTRKKEGMQLIVELLSITSSTINVFKKEQEKLFLLPSVITSRLIIYFLYLAKSIFLTTFSVV